MTSPAQLRQSLRDARRTLSPAQRHALDERIIRQILKYPRVRNSQHIACYLANDGEVDLTAVIEWLWAMDKVCYLPVLNGLHHDRMLFAPYYAGDPLLENRYGIPEPVLPRRALVSGQCLDLVLAPLVGFDRSGARLGMGGGYYDRTFAFLRHRRRWRRPHLLGVAYDFQRVPKLAVNAWDVPLHTIVTDQALYRA